MYKIVHALVAITVTYLLKFREMVSTSNHIGLLLCVQSLRVICLCSFGLVWQTHRFWHCSPAAVGAFEYPKTNSRNGNKEELYLTLSIPSSIYILFLILTLHNSLLFINHVRNLSPHSSIHSFLLIITSGHASEKYRIRVQQSIKPDPDPLYNHAGVGQRVVSQITIQCFLHHPMTNIYIYGKQGLP